MKKITALLLFCLFQLTAYSQATSCARVTNFGTADLCLPAIEGLKECYLEPKVTTIADATEAAMNTVLGFYLSDDTYARKAELGTFSFDNYCKFYGTNQIENIDFGQDMLQEMNKVIGGNFIKKNWETIKSHTDDLGFDIEIGQPVEIENYSLNEKSFTYVMLTKYQISETESYTLAMTISGILVNKRMVWMAYYLNYENEETIEQVKKKSNEIISSFININE